MKAGQYKTYQRGRRTYVLENKFSRGMRYSDNPILEGEHKVLVNYDLSPDRTTLTPRSALITQDPAYSYGMIGIAHSASMYLIDYAQGDKYTRLITGDRNLQYIGVTYHDNNTPTAIHRHYNIYNPNSVSHVPVVHDLAYKEPSTYMHVGTTAYDNDFYYIDAVEPDFYRKFSIDDPKPQIVEPRELSASEAAKYGYNMLLENPYDFKDEVLNESTPHVVMQGLLPYDPKTNVITFDPRINSLVKYRAFYTMSKGKYVALWRTRGVESANWELVQAEILDLTDGAEELSCDIRSTGRTLLVQVMIFPYKDTKPTPQTAEDGWLYPNANGTETRMDFLNTATNTIESIEIMDIPNNIPAFQVIQSSFNFSDDSKLSMRGFKIENYDLSTSRGMCYWNKSIVFYAPENAENTLFVSAYQEPEYVPYPNNCDTFDEEIMYCVPYMGDLLVFTESKLYKLTLNPQGGWLKIEVQGNLSIAPSDFRFVQIVKNMVYFKSGDAYYMIVPKAKTQGELTLAPISRNLDELFQNFSKSIKDILRSLYGVHVIPSNVELICDDAYSYLDYEDIHNVYKLNIKNIGEITVEILYNSVIRNWRMYVYQTNLSLFPYTQNATKETGLLGLGITYYKFIDRVKNDDTLDILPKSTQGMRLLPHQLLDTGHHDYNIENSKRLRELQFYISNTSLKSLFFNLEYVLDGSTRKPMYTYSAQYIPTPDPQVVEVVLTPHTHPVMQIPNYTQLGFWKIGQSRFPTVKLWKVRVPISGRGYAPRFKLLSTSEKRYEILNYTWIFRQLYLR